MGKRSANRSSSTAPAAFMTCALCRCAVAPNQQLQHRAGRKHQSMRFYGEDGHTLRPINRGESLVRPADVADVVVQAASRARQLVMPRLVVHTGVTHFKQASSHFDMEPLCSAFFRLREAWPDADTIVHLENPSPAELLCVAERLARGEKPRILSINVHELDAGLAEYLMSGALHALAGALQHCRGRPRVALLLDNTLRERRLVATFVSRLSTSLMHATVACLDIRAAFLRPEDTQSLHDAAWRAWHARAVAFLLGSHARVGASSLVGTLPSPLLQLVIEMAAVEGRTRVHVSSAGAAPAGAPPPAAVAGPDLAHVAAMAIG